VSCFAAVGRRAGEPVVVVGISHTPWIAERAASMGRLRERLVPAPRDCTLFEMTDRVHVSVWSERMWSRALELSNGVGHCVFLQDDTAVPPFFWDAIRAILSVVPYELVGLHLHHPGALDASRAGERFITTASCVGVGYAMHVSMLAHFLRWRATLLPEYVYRTSEDDLLDAWMVYHRMRAWHPVPTIVRVDTSIGSTGGGGGRDDADDQYMRETVLGWEKFRADDLTDPAWWRAGLRDPPRHLIFAGAARPGIPRRHFPAGFDGHLVR